MIKIKKLSLIFFLICTQNSIVMQASTTVTQANQLQDSQNKTAALLFSHIIPISSSNEKIVDQIYGTTGLNIAATDLINIKKTYCYLEFLVKLDKVKNDANFKTYINSFQTFIEQQTNNELIMPTQQLITSNDWQSVTITTQDLINSLAWQNFLKAMICDSFDNNAQIIVDITEAENQIENYLQNIEMAYPTNDYTQLRLYLESIELQLLMQLNQQKLYLTQTNDWKNLNTKNLQNAITTFKTTDFYKFTHTSQTITHPQTGLQTQPAITSPTQEQIACYFMFIYIQMTINNTMNIINLSSMLTTTPSNGLSPNFFNYISTDFIYLNDYLTLKNLIESNKTNPIKTTVTMVPTDNIPTSSSSNVTIQSVNNSVNTDSQQDPISMTDATQEQATNQLSEKIFNNNFPTDSIYAAAIDAIYGSSGLNISAEEIANIKKIYCYLEFLVKLNKVNNDHEFTQYASDFKSFMQPSSDGTVIMPTQTLIESDGWQSITITDNDIINSSAWQTFIQAMICDCIDSQTEFIVNSAQINNQITGYLPSIEATYNDDEFTQMRLYTESIQLQALLQTEQQQRYLQQSITWRDLSSDQLTAAITTFKTTDFYTITHQNSSLTKKSAPTTAQTQQQILSYFMLLSVQNKIYELMTLDNLVSFLNQATSTNLSPNFFNYTNADLIYLYDYITLTSLIAQNKIDLQNNVTDQITTTQTDANNVTIQAIKNPFKKSNEAVAKAFKKSDKATGKGIKFIIKNIDTGIGKMSEGLATAFIDINSDLIYGFIAIGSKSKAEKDRSIIKAKMDAHKNILTTVLTAIIVTIIATTLFPLDPMLIGGYAIAAMVVDKRVSKPVMKAMMTVMMPIMIAMTKMTTAFTTGFIAMSAGLTYAGCEIGAGLDPKAHINPKLQAYKVQAKLNQYKNTLNIIMSVVITIVITVVIALCTAGAGLAAAAAIDAGLFGAEAAATAATTAATIATTEATAASASVVTATATEATAQVAADAAEAAVQQATEQGADQATIQTLKTASTQAAARYAATTTARETAQTTAQQAEDVATQATAKAVARQTAIAATKDLAEKEATETTAQQMLEQATAKGEDTAIEEAYLAQTTAARQAAEQTVKDTAANAEKQSAQLTVKQASYKTAQAAAQKASADQGVKQTILIATKESAAATAKNATIAADKSAADLATQQGVTVAAKQAVQTAAKNLADAQQMFDEATTTSDNTTLLDQATTARTTAEQNLKVATANAEKQSTLLAKAQTANRTAQITALKSTVKSGIATGKQYFGQMLTTAGTNPILETDIATNSATTSTEAGSSTASTSSTQTVQTSLLNTQQAADKSAADLAEKQATKQLADQSLQNAKASVEKAQAIFDKNENEYSQQALDGAQANFEKATTEQAQASQEFAQASTTNTTKQAELSGIKNIISNNEFNEAITQNAQLKALQAAKDSGQITEKEFLQAAIKIQDAQTTKTTGMTAFETAQASQASGDNAIQSILAGARQDIMTYTFAITQAINAGLSTFNALGAANQDKNAILQAEQEQQSIETLWSFVENNKVAVAQEQNLFVNELHKKYQAAFENQIFGLQYYNNFLNGSADLVQQQIAQALAQQYIQMLTPDNNGLTIADIGSTWGLETKFVYLYPSQGFITTTLGRPDFPYAQEVAQAPLASQQTNSPDPTDLSDNQPQATKLWFNQRAVSVVNQSADQPLNIEIKFRVIYTLTTAYHVGLYLGGDYNDYSSPQYLKNIQNTGTIDIDEAKLAKMLVIKRDDATTAPSLGLYENEGKGWIIDQPLHPTIMNMTSIYHMSANLDKNKLTIAFWTEDNPSAKITKTVSVTRCDQRTFGIIFSGIAIEWGVVQPATTITENNQTRTETDGQTEINRERASKAQWKQMLNPQFGSMTIQSPGMSALLQGQYLYTTQSTNLVDGQGKPMTDYIIFATSNSGTVTNLGMSPGSLGTSQLTSSTTTNIQSSPQTNCIVSLISGNVYDSTNKIISYQQNAWQLYAQQNSTLTQPIAGYITQAAQIYQQQIESPVFGKFQLTAVSQAAINAGIFIYTCPTTISQLDASGNPILDYLVMAEIVNGKLGTIIGMPPSNLAQGMVSLISGNVYSPTSNRPIDGGYTEMTQYLKQYPQIPSTISSLIINSATAYNSIVQAQTQTAQVQKQAQANVIASQTISLSNLLNATPPTTGGQQIGLSAAAPTNIIPTSQSISNLQTEAAGNATVQITGIGPAGLNFNSSTTNSSPIITPNTAQLAQQNITNQTPTIPAQNTSPTTTIPPIPQAPAPITAINNSPQPSQPVSSTINNSAATQNLSNQFQLAGSSGFSL